MNGLILHESSRGIDMYSPESGLLKKRILFFTEEVTPESSAACCASAAVQPVKGRSGPLDRASMAFFAT